MESSGAAPERAAANLWPEIDRIVAHALEISAEERASYLAAECSGKPELRADVESLIHASVAAGDFLERAAPAAPEDDGWNVPPVDRVGSYRLIEKIGHGGMSVVYRAERDDGQFQKEAAVKLLATGWISPESLRRFLAERQILATLDHPNICRLLDGAVANGAPYLVMDYVDGVTVLDYCREHGLGERERLELFRHICAAVQYAHQRLIVHRDIKPGNVLVTRQGQVKLMDFGIAKVLAEGGGPDQTQAGFGAMTPGYASPEQMGGGPITTQTDVYSLGVLLFELITGKKPYEAAGKSVSEILAIIDEADLSAAACPAEIIAIARKAMSKEPRDRYDSASTLDEDIGRYLRGEPVRAVSPSRWYMLRKWMVRRRTPLIAVAAATIMILSSTAFALWSAAEAQRERAVAEQRFRDVRRLANKVLFEYPLALRQIAASTSLQVRMATDSLQYLDDLSRSRSSDADMLLELARGYVQIGTMLGAPRTSNLGQREKSTQAYRKARKILEELLQRNPNMPAARHELATVLRRLSQTDTGNPRRLAEQSLALWEDLYREQNRPEDLFNIGWAHVRLAELDLQSDHARKAVEYFQRTTAAQPNAVNAVHQQAYAQRLLARALLQRNAPDTALTAAQQAKTLDERARSLLGNNAAYAMEISIDLQLMAISYLQRHDIAPARKLLEDTADIRREALRSNRGDEWIQHQYLDVLCWLGFVAEQQSDRAAARRTYAEAVKTAPALTAAQHNDDWNMALGFAYGSDGLLKRSGPSGERCSLLLRSAEYFGRVRRFEFPVFQARAEEVKRAAAACSE